MRYALVNRDTFKVVNTILGTTNLQLPSHMPVIAVASDDAKIGDDYNRETGEFVTPPTIEPVLEAVVNYQRAIENHVDAVAQAKSYKDAVSLASYVNSTIPQWSSEAAAFVAWRDAVWNKAYTDLANIQAGLMTVIPTVEEFISDLPVIEW